MNKFVAMAVAIVQAYVLFPVMAHADSAVVTTVPSGLQEGSTSLGEAVSGTDLESAGDLPTLVGNLINIILGILGIICIAFVIYAGILYLTDQGEGKKAEKAKKLLIATIIGMVLIVAAYAISTYVIGALIQAAG